MSNIADILQKQREYFESGATKKASFRIEKLKTLGKAIKAHEEDILNALKKDLNKAPFEAYAAEILTVLDEINYTVKHISSWMRPKRVRTPILSFPAKSFVISEPYGISLIISPWNYPFQLAFAPLIGSIAGGNCTIIKPSEYSSSTSSVISKIINDHYDESFIAVVEGGPQTSMELLEQKFDYIFFTGSTAVGRKIMDAAAKNLTPVTLELGGKSPCIVDKDANIDLAAKRIAWGKFLNAGQTCVAPDYILVHSDVKKALLAALGKYIREFYGDEPCSSCDLPRVVNQKHFDRLIGLMSSGNIVVGGKSNKESLQIAPAVIDNIGWNDPIMKEEIFGPLLPVMEYSSLPDVISAINSRPKPLALYIFTNNSSTEKLLIDNISFGGGCINDTIMHLATPYIPFGGVGESGIGGYHGKSSFDTFTHKKGILKKSNVLDIKFRYPPYRNKLKSIKRILR